MNKWNLKNALWMLLYVVLYVIGSVITCVFGSIHPFMFVCYQITAGILLSGVVIKAFDKVRAFGVALCLAIGMELTFIAIGDAVTWHVVPVIVIGVLAEVIRLLFKYNTTGDLIAAVIMTFSTFGYYGQIWFNRDYTYECAVEEMPAGYAESLMTLSPSWAFPVVVIIGVILSVLVINITVRIFKLRRK